MGETIQIPKSQNSSEELTLFGLKKVLGLIFLLPNIYTKHCDKFFFHKLFDPILTTILLGSYFYTIVQKTSRRANDCSKLEKSKSMNSKFRFCLIPKSVLSLTIDAYRLWSREVRELIG